MTQPVSYIVFDYELVSDVDYKHITLGGTCYVALNGNRNKATLYNPDNNYASLVNPVSFTNGKIRFAIQQSGGGQAFPPSVDLFIMLSDGRFLIRQACTPGDVQTLFIDTNERYQAATIPFSLVDTAANTETSTGFSLPQNSTVEFASVMVVTPDTANKTIKIGMLSTQTGGSASGFVNGASLSAAGMVKPTINGASATTGSFLIVASGAGSTNVYEPYVVGATAKTISYTIGSAAASGDGYLIIQYTLPI